MVELRGLIAVRQYEINSNVYFHILVGLLSPRWHCVVPSGPTRYHSLQGHRGLLLLMCISFFVAFQLGIINFFFKDKVKRTIC